MGGCYLTPGTEKPGVLEENANWPVEASELYRTMVLLNVTVTVIVTVIVLL